MLLSLQIYLANSKISNCSISLKIIRFIHTCKKNKNKPCRFHYGRFLTERTIIAKLIKVATEFQKYEILKKRENIMMQVQDYIDSFHDPNKDSYIENTRIDEVIYRF